MEHSLNMADWDIRETNQFRQPYHLLVFGGASSGTHKHGQCKSPGNLDYPRGPVAAQPRNFVQTKHVLETPSKVIMICPGQLSSGCCALHPKHEPVATWSHANSETSSPRAAVVILRCHFLRPYGGQRGRD